MSRVCTGERVRDSQTCWPLLSWNNERQISAVMIRHDISPRLGRLRGRLPWSILDFIYFLLHTHQTPTTRTAPTNSCTPVTFPHLRGFKQRRRLGTGHCSLLWKSKGIFRVCVCVKDRLDSCTVHGVSWASGVASLQTVWLHPPSRPDNLNWYDGFVLLFLF